VILQSSRKIDFNQFVDRIRDLAPRSRAAYAELLRHYWRHGDLPLDDHDLAAICGVHVISLRRMKVQLGWVFETDVEGRWRDVQLEAERLEAARLAGSKSVAGKLGAIARWGDSNPPAPAAKGTSEASSPVAHGMAEGVNSKTPAMADAIAPAIANGVDSRFADARFATAGAMASPLALSDDDDDSFKVDSSSSSSSSMVTGASGAMAGAMPPAMANAMAPDPTRPPKTVAIAMANGMAQVTENPMANAMAAAGPAAGADAAPDGRSAQATVTDRELVDLVLAACGDKIAPKLRHVREMKPFRAMMRDGCDLKRDILPVLEGVRTLAKPLETFHARWIKDQVHERRATPDEVLAPAGQQQVLVWVRTDTPQWKEWLRFRKAEGRVGLPERRREDGETGWDFPSPWPPDYQSALMAAE